MMAAKAMRTKARGEARLAAEPIFGAVVADDVPVELLVVVVLVADLLELLVVVELRLAVVAALVDEEELPVVDAVGVEAVVLPEAVEEPVGVGVVEPDARLDDADPPVRAKGTL
jgi:hypothetical protein